VEKGPTFLKICVGFVDIVKSTKRNIHCHLGLDPGGFEATIALQPLYLSLSSSAFSWVIISIADISRLDQQ
jgi:hypothetical protein